MLLNRYIFLLLVAVATAVDDVHLHVVNKDGFPAITLLRLVRDPNTGAEYPALTEFVASFGLSPPPPVADYYADGGLFPTDASFGRDSTLWLWWEGFTLDRRRLTLRGSDDEEDGSEASCAAGGASACLFVASLRGGDYNVTLFTSDDSTVLPPSLFVEGVDATMELEWDAGEGETGSMTIHGPFVLGNERGGIILSHNERHHTRFSVSIARRYVQVVPQENFEYATPFASALLTLSLLYALFVLLSSWTLDWMHAALALPLLVVPFLFVGNTSRLVLLVYIAARTLAGAVDGGRHAITAEYSALETMWTVTMILHEEQANMTSLLVKAALIFVSVRELTSKRRADGPFAVVDVLVSFLLLCSFILDDGRTYFDVELTSRYGIDALVVAGFAALFLVAMALEYR